MSFLEWPCWRKVIRLVATAAERESSVGGARGGYVLTVAPTRVPATSFLGGCVATDMGVIFETDIYETQSFKTNETGVFPTAAAMLRDLVTIFSK